MSDKPMPEHLARVLDAFIEAAREAVIEQRAKEKTA